jgi:hypothetical protein
MAGIMVMQGREVSGADIGLIRDLLVEHPHWGRTRLSKELCGRWGWRNAQGRPKDMAARTLLLKLERGGYIRLPPRQRPSSNGFRNRHMPVTTLKAENAALRRARFENLLETFWRNAPAEDLDPWNCTKMGHSGPRLPTVSPPYPLHLPSLRSVGVRGG